MKKLLPVVLLGLILFLSCQKMPVGFLQAEYVGYAPDSLVIKAELDTSYVWRSNPVWDLNILIGYSPEFLIENGIMPEMKEYNNLTEYNIYKRNIPWVSVPIQGLKGTAPIKVEISKVLPKGSESDKLKSLLNVRGSSGIISLPTDHGISSGRYSLSFRFSNESWEQEKEDLFTIIIE